MIHKGSIRVHHHILAFAFHLNHAISSVHSIVASCTLLLSNLETAQYPNLPRSIQVSHSR